MFKFFFISILFIICLLGNDTIIFVHPSTLFGIPGELFFPAIQNILLPGFYQIKKDNLSNKSYNEVFLLFLHKYSYLFKKNDVKYYMFNWSGVIYPIQNKEIASVELFYEIFSFKKNNPNDKIILIGCSHGGNVILGMSDLLKLYNIEIDTVVLLGTPIGENSDKNAMKKLFNGRYVFKQIINIYSNSDFIQKIDLVFNDFKFCKRILNERTGIINYRITGFGHIDLWHKVLWKDPFVIQVPRIMSALADDNK